jgi:hypothetical protein
VLGSLALLTSSTESADKSGNGSSDSDDLQCGKYIRELFREDSALLKQMLERPEGLFSVIRG